MSKNSNSRVIVLLVWVLTDIYSLVKGVITLTSSHIHLFVLEHSHTNENIKAKIFVIYIEKLVYHKFLEQERKSKKKEEQDFLVDS